MATDLERLVVQLSADVKQYNNALNKAVGTTNRQARVMESRFAQMNRRIGTSLAGVGRGLALGLASSLTLRGMQSLSDAATKVDNSLKVTGLSGKNLEEVYNHLRDSAVKNGAPLETLAELYSRASMAATNLGASQSQLLKFSDAVAVSLRVSGKSAQEAGGALLQLGQLLSGNVVQAQEYNSLIDGAYPLLQAVAAGLKEAGGDVGKLTQLVKSGQVPTKAFFDAFLAGSNTLTDKVATAQFTVSQSLENLRTGLIDVAREFNKSTGASERFAGGINTVAKAVADFDVSGFIQKIEDAQSSLQGLLADLGNSSFFTKLNQALGITDSKGNMVPLDTKEAQDKAATLEREVKILQDTIAKNTELGFDNKDALAQLAQVQAALAGVRGQLATMPASTPSTNIRSPEDLINSQVPFNPLSPLTQGQVVSLADYAKPGKSGSGKGGGRSREDSFERETRQIKERTANLQAETAAQASVNPLVDDYDYAITKARASQELINAAQKAGVNITPELKATIDSLAEGYANATVESNKLDESQRNLRQRAEEMRDLGKDVMGGFINDLISGKSAADALADALGKIGNKLLDMALDSLFHPVGGGPGGLLGGAIIPGILHSGGVAGSDGYGHGRSVSPAAFAGAPRYHSGGIAGLKPGEVPAILQKGEIVLPRGMKTSAGSTTVVSPQISIDARGAQQGVGAEITAALDKYSRHTLPELIKQVNNDPRRRG